MATAKVRRIKPYSGYTKDTPDKLLLDAGAFFKNFEVGKDTYKSAKAAGKCLGATIKGGEFSAKPNIRRMELDGVKTRTVGDTLYTLNSRIGITGILKKIGYIIAVTVGIVADYLISSALVNCGINVTINCCIGMIVTVWFIINELISILENLSEIGTPLPKFLVSIVKRLKNTVEAKTNEIESEE